MKQLITVLLLCVLTMSVTACGREVSSTQKESQAVARQLSVFSKGQPVPAFSYSFERDLMIQLYRLRNEKVATHTVWRSDYGMIEGDTPSIGYGLPYDVSLTNPLQLDHKRVKGYGSHTTLEGTVEQQEPNGTYASKNTTATWVMSVDSDTGQMVPIYIEGKVTVYPYPVTVDYNTNRVYKAGKASTTISIDNANDFMQIR